MAAFDPIEFFGVGHSRDIAIVRHARTGSANSISLSSVGSPPSALEKSSTFECRLPAGFQRSRSPQAPRSPSRAFADITPEDSVYGQPLSPSDTSAAPPNVSGNSSWASNPDQPFAVGRYVRNHERHETVLLALSAAPQCPKLSPFSTPHTLPPADGLGEEDEGFGASDDEEYWALPKDGPIHRYVADVQPHEQLALALERQNQMGSPQHTYSTPRSHEPSSSISLSDGQEVEEEDDDDMALIAEVGRKSRELRTRRALAASTHPRLQKRPRGKRHNESPPQGHRDKKTRWG